MKSRGFTLLEVMVVLVIIGLLLSMVNLSSSDRAAQNDTEQYARRILGAFSQYREEAVFQNLDIGAGFIPGSILLLIYQDVSSAEFTSGLNIEELDRLKKNPWQTFDGRLASEQPVPEEIRMQLTVGEEEVDFEELLDDDEGVRPAILFLSSDEYTPFELILTHQDDDTFRVLVSGDGFNPVRMSTERADD